MLRKDPLKILFNGSARHILYSLVDRLEPDDITDDINDDYFEPTISAVFHLFDQSLSLHMPDLYEEEWQAIANALGDIPQRVNRFFGKPGANPKSVSVGNGRRDGRRTNA